MQVHAFVVMPDHVHVLLTPQPDVSLEKAIQYLKGGFSFLLKSQRDVWERGSNETRMVDAVAFNACTHYIDQNPVAARLAEEPHTFEFSSAATPHLTDPAPLWFGGKSQG